MKNETRSVPTWTALVVLAIGWLATPILQAADDSVGQSIARAHATLWSRFISPEGGIYDFTGLNGEVSLPTAEECERGFPNALGWWTPIENGGFFGGLYLDALCNRWKALRTPESAESARRVASGLLGLAKSDTPGFIARGHGQGGRGHYPASSSDQTFPWFYGMWRYAQSGIPSAGERAVVVAALERAGLGLEQNGWKMPADRLGFGSFGHWSGGFAGTDGIFSGAEPQFDAAARLLFVLRALADVTGSDSWMERYNVAVAAKPYGVDRTRLEICAGGVQYVAPGEPPRYPESPNLWTSTSSQAGLRALWEMESDETRKASFRRGLDANARSAARFVAGYRRYDNNNTKAFDLDWRKVGVNWKPQATIAEAVALGTLQYRTWNKISPRKVTESEDMRDPLFAAWIVVLSGNPAVVGPESEAIRAALTHYEWEKLHTCLFFMAECVYWQQQLDRAVEGQP